MALTGAPGRRHLLLAPYLALVLVVTGVVFYAVTAQGYQAHETELNDGGVWVTNSSDGFYGRVNKPIGQLDGALFARLESSLDIIQDGAAVVGWDVSAGLISTVDPAGVRIPPGEEASVPTAAAAELAGGSLAVLDPDTGKVWTQRTDPRLGLPVLSALDQDAPARVEAGGDAALAVTTGGTVLVASGAEDTLTTLTPRAHDHVAGEPEPLPDEVGAVVDLTAVGETPVVLDADSGALLVPGGGRATLAPGAVLQQPGPAADGVLVAGADRLQVVDTATGAAETVVDGVAGRPAAPVRLGDCVYGAWAGGRGTVATVCHRSEPVVASLGPGTSDLVFRVNRGEILLNDRSTGAVWEIESEQPTRLDQWDAFQERRTEDDDEEKNQEQDQGDRRPPKAKPDDLGARPGRTTVLHPLDNDTAPVGRILSIRSVQDVRGSEAEVTIGPDGQTVQVRMPEGAGTTRFEYTVDDGRRGVSAHATVTVTPRQDAENAVPALREGFEPRLWTVPAGGTLDVPVLGDWRDREDGDPLTLHAAVAAGGERTGAVARTTAAGRVRLSAPAEGGPVTVRYAVTDGIGEPVQEVLRFRVQDRRDRQSFPATAEPDVVSGEAGEPITIRPLANDLPGSDPVTPEAALAIAGKVAPTGGASVTTDLVEGTVTFRSATPRTYFLDYAAAYGNADLDNGRIRVDVRAPERPPLSPVAMPDNVTLHGQASSLVDVLANDLDPTGGLLVVQHATPQTDNQLDVAVVDGRWVRLSARQGQLVPNPQLVRYTISNGEKSGVQGEIVVSQRPPPDDDTPVTETDRVTVRAGSGVSVAVLDNDFSPSGDALGLVGNVPGHPAGQLAVQRPGDERVPTGTAYVAGRFVRYVAPPDLEDAQTLTVQYVATSSRGATAPGRVEVTVIPRTRPNEAPGPPTLEGRVVSGDTVRLRLPGSGVDPDGDPVTLGALGSAPALGRVVRMGASSLEYRAFPASVGTDEFTYTVTDPSGSSASGTVRVVVAPPAPSQPPLAVPDTVTVEPGRRVVVDVLANDHLSAGDRGVLTLVDPPAGAGLESETGPLVLQSPPTGDGRDLEVVYRLDNGLATSQATVTLRTVRPWNNPPVVFDAFGEAADAVGDADADQGRGPADDADAGSVTVDVLETAYDPDGPTVRLRVVEVAAPPGVATSTDGRRVTVQQGAQPQVVPFRVEDADGGVATASLYVPALRGAAPYVDPDALIRLDPGGSVTVALPDVVVDPAGGTVRFTLKDRISAAPPAALVAAVTGEDTFEVRAGERASGPGAVSFEVTTGTSVDDPDAVLAVLSVPVQVGEEAPVLRCPTDPVPVAQGQTIELDVTSLCHVWTPDPDDLGGVEYRADWLRSSAGLAIIEPEGRTVSVAADGSAAPGTTGVLTVTAPGSLPGEIPVEVVDVPPPSLAPIRVADMRAGETRTLDLAPYLRPGVADADPTVVAVEQLTGLDLDASADGSSVTLRTGPAVAGRAQFRVVMSDVSGDAPPGRRVEGRIALEVLDRPDTPSAPVPGRTVRSREVRLQWVRPEANGSPIDVYEVRAPGAGARRCPTTTCEITGLTNGRAYAFQVRARNAVGWSGWSASSAAVTPDAKPGVVGPVRLVRVGDRTLTLRWSPPTAKTSRIRRYLVTWPGGTRTTTTPSIVVGGLTNGNRYVFSVQAENELDVGPARRSAPYQSVGTPGTPQAPQVTDQETAGDQGAVTLSWAPVNPNGPDPVRYTVLRNGSALPGCTDLLATRCDSSGITYDGTTYTYAVRATNQGVDAPGGAPRSATGPTSSWSAVGQPEAWGDWSVRPTGSDARAVADFTVPASRGARSTVRIFVNDVQVEELQATGRVSRDVGVPHNDGPHAVRLRVCNEAQACSDSATRTVQTYGPLNDGHVLRIEPRPDGTRLSWTVTVDSNGDPATVRVTSNQGRDQTFAANGVDVQSFTTSSRDLGYSATERLTVTISDSSPRRGSGSRTASYTTGAAPTPTVAVSKGASCGPGSGNGPCNSSASSPTECNNSSCGRIVITTARWSSATLSCSLDSTHGNSGWNNPYTVTANTSDQLGAWFGYPDGRVRATCTGDDLGGARRTVTSPWYDWPG